MESVNNSQVQHRWLREQSVGDIKVICSLIEVGEYLYPKFKYRVRSIRKRMSVIVVWRGTG